MTIPDLDREQSPYTGFTRTHWAHVADELLLSLRPWASEDHARILPPGKISRNGADSDGLEGFARSFLMAGARIAGENGQDPLGLADWYARGFAAGVDPDGANPWPRPDVCGQAKVEACSLALMLDRTRPWIWDRLDTLTQSRIIDWFATIIGTDYPPINWVWFRLVVLTFLRSVDERFRTGDRAEEVMADIRHDLAVHESLIRDHGWFADGPERAFDHYDTWAFAVYPLLWADMTGNDLLTDADRAVHRERLADFISDAVGLVGGDGGPLIQGRSLIYRFATAAPFWVAAAHDIPVDGSLRPGLLRRAASGELAHFLAHGVPDEDGLLNLGWFGRFEEMSQDYSGPGSPYWAAKGFLGLMLPADHQVWTAAEEPLPAETGDSLSTVDAPGWLVSRTADDGIVRVLNHGTDHANPGATTTDSAVYARIGYSTVTAPALAGEDAQQPCDSTVGVIHPQFGWSHRSGFERCDLRVVEGPGAPVGLASSLQHCHWVDVTDSSPDHGSGRAGVVHHGPDLLVTSVVREAVEVRIVQAPQGSKYPIGIAGWPLSGAGDIEASGGTGSATVILERPESSPLTSTTTGLLGDLRPSHHRAEGVSPLGPGPWIAPQVVCGPLEPGAAMAAAVVLSAAHPDQALPDSPSIREDDGRLTVVWPDGVETPIG